VYAHLRRDSQRVALGDEITKGDVIASCGNSGNTTKPHLHIKRQDVASMLTATGLPWAIEGAGEEGTPGFPKNGDRVEFR
jgi:murein DD-endopeptidase MepM/ murein hydrolase activator NlpD